MLPALTALRLIAAVVGLTSEVVERRNDIDSQLSFAAALVRDRPLTRQKRLDLIPSGVALVFGNTLAASRETARAVEAWERAADNESVHEKGW